MRPLKMPPQILRLVLLTITIVATYMVARFFLTPASFGALGHYRANAMGELQNRPITFAGKKSCDECHSDHFQKLSKSEHKTLSCESCHGPAQAHVENPDLKLEKLTFAHCVRCHEASPSRPKWLKQIVSKDHYTGQRCTECHSPHQPNEVP
jgi:hypothetical protein